ncbi:HepT-like ribonuclease domain-containing protein [Sulfurimonas crateris]|nr:HepT-like ribonuclease domain-containing protein [Sulfurimonas crateris]
MSKIKFDLLSLIESIDKIQNYSQEFLNADDFYNDQKSFDASMMQLVVIGETITRLDESFKKTHQHIPWQKIKDFRNIIAHDYFGIDADEIWDIIQNKLIPLRSEIQILVDKM